jgi:hypothetical protein
MSRPAGGGSEAEHAGGMDSLGDLAVVLHSHMPYVEGFGTYPFGEEWLFDAVVRSHIPVLEVADRVTVTVTPVLADQLEAEGVAERMRAFVGEFRIGSCEADARDLGPGLREACLAERDRYRDALDRLEELGDDLTAMFRDLAAGGRVELVCDPPRPAADRDRGGSPASSRRRAAVSPQAVRRAVRVLAARMRL